MIPLRDQALIGQRFQRDLHSRVRIDFFTRRKLSLLVPGREDCPYCDDVETMLRELAGLSDRIALSVHDLEAAGAIAKGLAVDKAPATVIRGQTNRPVRFFGLPTGSQFVGFIETLLDAARGAVELAPAVARQLRKLRSEVRVQVFVSPTCPYSPLTARAALRFGLANPKLRVDVLEAAEFPALCQRYAIRAVPVTVIDERVVVRGALDEAGLLRFLFQVVEGHQVTVDLGRQGPTTPLPEATGPARPTSSGGIVLPR